jgi:hypothetical protein
MHRDILNRAQLQSLAASGEEFAASVVGADGKWRIFIHAAEGVRALSDACGDAHMDEPVALNSLADVERLLRELGVVQFEVDGSSLDRAMSPPPATADQEYDDWFRAQVQEALDDPRPAIPHDEAMRRIRAALKIS